MGKEDGPTIADPFVELDIALCGLRGKIGCFIINAQAHGCLQKKIAQRFGTLDKYSAGTPAKAVIEPVMASGSGSSMRF